MPEGDNLARIATVLRSVLVGRTVTGARARPGGVELGRVVGRKVESVEARGKHLLICFTDGLTLHTHLGLHGSWHRYGSNEKWRRGALRAVAVIEVPDAVCVCFDAPTVELLETRALAIHPVLARLGPDATTDDFDAALAVNRLRALDPSTAICDALLDQRAMAGVGNVYRSEVCFIERVNPFMPLGQVPEETVRRLAERSADLLRANRAGGRRVTTAPGSPGSLYVYGRTGRPCRRCGTPIGSRVTGTNARRVYWCPRCQA